MIQRIQTGIFNNYRTNNKAAMPIKSNVANTVCDKVSFKSSGAFLYEETESMINQVRERAMRLGKKELTAQHEDGTLISFDLEKKGMTLQLRNMPKEFTSEQNLARNALIETKYNAVSYFSKYATFMLGEMDEGEADVVIQRYLPALMD